MTLHQDSVALDHPGVEIILRDRAGATPRAPGAVPLTLWRSLTGSTYGKVWPRGGDLRRSTSRVPARPRAHTDDE